MQTGSLFDDCYEHVAAEAHDPREAALAQEVGGTLAEAVVTGAFLLAPEAEGVAALGSKGIADTAAIQAHTLGEMYGPDVLTPIGSLVDFGGCVVVDSVDHSMLDGIGDPWGAVANVLDPIGATVDVWGPSPAATDYGTPASDSWDAGGASTGSGTTNFDFGSGFDGGHGDSGGHDGGGGSPDGSF